MAARGGRGLRPGGVVRALGRLILFVALGFGVGLVFGLVTEEPELLADHLRGESESVSVAAPEGVKPESPSSAVGGPMGAPNDRDGAASELYASAATGIERLEPRRVDPPSSGGLPEVAAAPRPETSVARSAGLPESAIEAVRREPDWSIQVGAFSEQTAANRLAEGLRARYPVSVLPAGKKGGRWRVRVQPIRGEARAREMAERLKRDERLPTWVTPMEDRSGS